MIRVNYDATADPGLRHLGAALWRKKFRQVACYGVGCEKRRIGRFTGRDAA